MRSWIVRFLDVDRNFSQLGVLQIDEHFDITVLSSSRKDHSGMPEIGEYDPSVRVTMLAAD